MLSPKDPKVKNNLPEIKKKLKDPNLTVSFLPSSLLRQYITNGTHPLLQGMPKDFISLLLCGELISIQKRMLFEWLAGFLDEKNTFILDHGEFIINQTGEKIIQALNAPVSSKNPYKNVDFSNDLEPAKSIIENGE